MLTVLQALDSAGKYLHNKGIKSARLNSELLLSHILQCKRLELYLSFDRPLQSSEIDAFRGMLKRRSTFEPLQYLIGKVEFYGLEFEVNPFVLIPRPETELLVETVVKSVDKQMRSSILDIGSGSGNISIALAKSLPLCKVIGIDISEKAVEVANRNAKSNNVENQIMFIKENILDGFEVGVNRFDIVVSNPPYVSKEDFNNLEPELLLYEPKISLTDDADGLTFFKKISDIAKSILNLRGKIFFEIGAGQSERVKNILSGNNFTNISIKKDYAEIERVVCGEIM